MNQILQYELKWQKTGEKQYSVIYCRNAKVHHFLQQNRKKQFTFYCTIKNTENYEKINTPDITVKLSKRSIYYSKVAFSHHILQ